MYLSALAAALTMTVSGVTPHPAPRVQTPLGTPGPYHVIKVVKVGGDGGFDYVDADSAGRRLYIARSGPTPRVSIFDLDTLAPVGEIPNTSAHGVAVDPRSHHAFATSKPVAMWDSQTQTLIKTIDVDGHPDGLLHDDFNHRTYIFSHSAPNATVINEADGSVLGTIDLGGAPEQAATDGRGTIYVDLEDKGSVAVVNARTMKVTTTYSLNGKGGDAGLALDNRRHVLYVACREPSVVVMLDARNGKYLGDVPIGSGCDGEVFNQRTGECFASMGDGTLSIIKQTGSTFTVEQVVATMRGAKTSTIDTKTGNILLIAGEYTAPAAGQRRGSMVPHSFSVIVVGK